MREKAIGLSTIYENVSIEVREQWFDTRLYLSRHTSKNIPPAMDLIRLVTQVTGSQVRQ